eukprot:scaffold408_cov71-Cylindrotheca_fusiformis.AAC.25
MSSEPKLERGTGFVSLAFGSLGAFAYVGLRILWKLVFTSCCIFVRESVRYIFPIESLEQNREVSNSFVGQTKGDFQRAANECFQAGISLLDNFRKALPMDVVQQDFVQGWHMFLKPALVFSLRLTRDLAVCTLGIVLHHLLGSLFPVLGQLLWPTIVYNVYTPQNKEIRMTIEMNHRTSDDTSTISELTNDRTVLLEASPKPRDTIPKNIDSVTVSTYTTFSPLSDQDRTLHSRRLAKASGGLPDIPDDQLLQQLRIESDQEEDVSSAVVFPLRASVHRRPIDAIISKWNRFAEMGERGVVVSPRRRTMLGRPQEV